MTHASPAQFMRARLSIAAVLAATCLLAFAPRLAQAQDVARLDAGTLAGAFLAQDAAMGNLKLDLYIQASEGDAIAKEGLAHYLEHLVWLSVAREHPLANAPGANAFTSQWAIGYSLEVPIERLTPALNTLLAVFEPPALAADFMNEEVAIIRQEYESRQDGTNVEAIFENSRRWLYADSAQAGGFDPDAARQPTPQGLARSLLGTPAQIDTFTPGDAAALHAQTHVPERAILVIRGAISPDQLAEPLAAALGTGNLELSQVPRPSFNPAPAQTQRFVTEDDRGKGEIFALRKLIALPPVEDPVLMEEALSLTRQILSGTRDESLRTPLYYEEFVVASLALNMSMVDDQTAALILSAEPEPGVEFDALEPRILQALQDAAARGVSQDTLDKTRDLIFRERASQTPTDAAFGPLYSGLIGRRDIVPYVIRNERLSQVTTAQINTLLKLIAAPARTAVIEVRKPTPQTEQATQNAGDAQ